MSRFADNPQIDAQSREKSAQPTPNPESRILNPLFSFVNRLHHDERGTISIMTVFALFMFTILLVQVVNVGRHVDDKIRQQNAADAAAYSGGVVMARSMNTLAFTNHLEAEVFALTAYMRTAAMRDEEGQLMVQSLTPEILAKWEEIAPIFEQQGAQAGFTKFQRLGAAIRDKVPLERNVVGTFSEMSARHADLTLPVLEYILHAGEAGPGGDGSGAFGGGAVNVPEGGFIPRFQRALVQATPIMANIAANETARRYGQPGERLRKNRDPLASQMWRTDAVAFAIADESDPLTRTVPAIDPSPTGNDGPPDRAYYETARAQRSSLARHYLELWIKDWMGPYFSYAQGLNGQNRPGRSTAKMSQFINLWRTFACGHLNVLLDVEYPDVNLPHVIRRAQSSASGQFSMEKDYQFVSVAYWSHIDEMFPGLFKNRLNRDGSDALTFAQMTIFLPRNRHLCCPWAWPVYVTLPDGSVVIRWRNNMEGMPQHWDLLNQNWQAKLMPANSQAVPTILQQQPPGLPNFRPPRFNGVSEEDFRQLNKH